MNHNAHFFIAIPISNVVRHELANLTEAMKGTVPFKSWVHPEDYHITLAFLGNASEEKRKELSEGLLRKLQKHSGFELKLSQPGVFGQPKSPRVLWYGLAGSAELIDLQQITAQACIETGFELDQRPYHPHITLARRWNSPTSFDKGIFDKMHIEKGNPAAFYVDHAVLYRTNMMKSPKYEIVKRFMLGERS